MVASIAAVMLGVVAIDRSHDDVPVAAPTVTAPAPMVAVLTGRQGVVAVSYDRASGRVTSAPNGIDIGAHAAELWVIPADGKPRSLGVIAAAADGAIMAKASAAPAMAPGATLAISVEPIGGSPTGQPTGPVILSGKLGAA